MVGDVLPTSPGKAPGHPVWCSWKYPARAAARVLTLDWGSLRKHLPGMSPLPRKHLALLARAWVQEDFNKWMIRAPCAPAACGAWGAPSAAPSAAGVGAAASFLPEHRVLCLGGSCGDSWCLAEVQMIKLCVPDTHIRRGGCWGEEIRLMVDVMWVGFFLFRGGKKQDAALPGKENLCGVVTAAFLCLRGPARRLERNSLSGTVEMRSN